MKIEIEIPDKVIEKKDYLNYFGVLSPKLLKIIENAVKDKSSADKESKDEMIPCTELDKLEQYLKNHNYCFKRVKSVAREYHGEIVYSTNQIIVYSKSGQRLWDAVCHPGSYGYHKGLIEIMGVIVDNENDTVEGYLTADDIIKRLGDDNC